MTPAQYRAAKQEDEMTKSTLSIQFDADRLDGEQWLVVETFAYGFSVVGKFATRAAAVSFQRRHR